MKKRVKIVDYSYRRNTYTLVNDQVRQKYLEIRGNILPEDIRILYMKDRQGRQIQDKVMVTHIFEGQYLLNAVRRAKRYIRSGRPLNDAPSHIALNLAAFSKADPEGFKSVLERRTVNA